MLVCILSLAGVPPLAGFAAKFLVLMPTVEKDVGLYTLAIIAIINVVISTYVYLRVAKIMFFDRPLVEKRFFPDITYRYAMIPPFTFVLFYFIGGFLLRQLYAYAASSYFLTINVYFGQGATGH
jgi:NADH-quinone oxidoreductase subunit N